MTDIEKNRHNWNGPPIVYAPDTDQNTDQPTIVDLFCGPGGISQGFKMAGFSSVLGVDIHEKSIDTYRKNHPESFTILGNIKTVNGQTHNDVPIIDVLDEENYGTNSRLAKILEKAGDPDVDVLAGGVPCQGFSLSNKKRDSEDERNYLFEELVKATKIIDPTVVIIENVSAMESTKDGAFVDAIHKCFEQLGYNIDHKVLNASHYGVPQKRNRLFFIATKQADQIEWPKETTPDTPITVADAISDLAPLEAGESHTKYQSEPQSQYQKQMRESSSSYTEHSAPNHQQQTIDRITNTKQGEPMYDRFTQRIRLAEDKPSPTIVSGGIRPQFQFGHPTQPRGLTVRERARIQSFPDQYVFEGGLTQGRVQTGMAVPPLLASELAQIIRDLL